MKAWQVMHYGEPDEMVLGDVPTPTPGKGRGIDPQPRGRIELSLTSCRSRANIRPSRNFRLRLAARWRVSSRPSARPWRTSRRGTRFSPPARGGGYAEYAVTPRAQADLSRFRPRNELHRSRRVPDRLPNFLSRPRRAAGAYRPANGCWCMPAPAGSACRQFSSAKSSARGSSPPPAVTKSWPFCKRPGGGIRNQLSRRRLGRRSQAHHRGARRGYDLRPRRRRCFRSIKQMHRPPRAGLLVIGFAGGRIPSIAANRLLLKNMSAVGVFWGRECSEDPSYHGKTHAALSALYEQGKIRPAVAAEFPLEKAVEALKMLADRKAAGKVVLTMA